jgi:hypothetical protein
LPAAWADLSRTLGASLTVVNAINLTTTGEDQMRPASSGQSLTKRQLVLEAMMYGRTTLRVYANVRADGSVSTGEAIEILPDGSTRQRAILCYAADVRKAAPLLRRMAREHARAAADPATVIGLIDGEYWLRELERRIDRGCVFNRDGVGARC